MNWGGFNHPSYDVLDKNMKKPLAVITGASSGIGAATAKAFSKAGYPTLLLSLIHI